jgi:tRNA1(Val) A37 N6-methylase TrmN6
VCALATRGQNKDSNFPYNSIASLLGRYRRWKNDAIDAFEDIGAGNSLFSIIVTQEVDTG